MMRQKENLSVKTLSLLTAAIFGIIAIFLKTHLVFGGDYFSPKNLKVTIGIFVLIIIIFVVASFIDRRDNNIDNNKKDLNTFVIDKNYDDTWASLIDFVTSSNYTIDNVEKSSGLITVYFGKKNPGEYVDCGLFNNTSYAQYLTSKYNSALVGQMSVTARALSENQTRIKVNASYKFSVANLQWKFVTGGSDSEMLTLKTTAPGASPERICQPSYKVEREFYNAIQGM